MPRPPRVTIPNFPYHVTQRGNRRQTTFFTQGDYRAYIQLLKSACGEFNVSILGWCLMPNHVHLVMVPFDSNGISKVMRKTNEYYAKRINFRNDWRGSLWQGRFHSSPMEEKHLLAALNYIELNPVRANLCQQPEEWPWSSASTRIKGTPDPLA